MKSKRTKRAKTIYKIHFFYLGKIYTLFAKKIEPSPELYNMCIISEIIFRTSPNIIVPSDEDVKSEFSKVDRLYIPLSYILRVDQMADISENEISDPYAIKGRGEDNLIRPIEFFSRPSR